MTKFSLVASVVLGAFVFAGCSANLARFSVATTSNVPIANATKGNYVEGEDCLTMFLGIPIGNTTNRVSGAVAKALEEAHKQGQPADALINVDVTHTFWNAILVGQTCVTAKGQAIGVK